MDLLHEHLIDEAEGSGLTPEWWARRLLENMPVDLDQQQDWLAEIGPMFTPQIRRELRRQIAAAPRLTPAERRTIRRTRGWN